jgi:hypothetical protein
MLVNEIPFVNREVKEAIRRFRLHRDVSKLLAETTPHIAFLARFCGYSLGHLHAAGETVDVAHPRLPSPFRSTRAIETGVTSTMLEPRERSVPSPFPARVRIWPPLSTPKELRTTMSSLPSRFVSATMTEMGSETEWLTGGEKAPLPSPNSTETLLLAAFATTRSRTPSVEIADRQRAGLGSSIVVAGGAEGPVAIPEHHRDATVRRVGHGKGIAADTDPAY